MQESDIESTPVNGASEIVGKADWLTVMCVTPIVENKAGVPEDDRRRFMAWLRTHESVDTLYLALTGSAATLTILARLAEAYAYYIEREFDTYAVELMCRAEFREDGTVTFAEPPTPSQRLARLKERVREV